MRDDHKGQQKAIKQQINSFCLRHGHKYSKTKWTGSHIKWLREIPLNDLQCEILDEYILSYNSITGKIDRLDSRIEELAAVGDYRDKVSKLRCFIGIKTHAALGLVVETGDFKRFSTGSTYASYLGLTPGEASSSNDINRLSITKAGNKHARTILVEAAQGICKDRTGYKSKDLVSRQKGNDPAVIAYADKANECLRRKYYKMVFRGK